MSYHLAAYTLNIANVANTDVPALVDDILTIFNGHFLLRKPYQLVQAFVCAQSLTRARFDSPTMRFYGNPYIRPHNVGVLPLSNPNVAKWISRPFQLPMGEEIAIQATDSVGTTERLNALIWLMAAMEALPPGNVYPVRFTSTGTAVVNSWTTIPYTMDTGIPTGQYAMVGSELQSSNGVAHRWIFDEQQERPGHISQGTLGGRVTDEDYLWTLGTMGRFYNTSLPRLQVLCNAGDAAHEGYMFLIPLGRAA